MWGTQIFCKRRSRFARTHIPNGRDVGHPIRFPANCEAGAGGGVGAGSGVCAGFDGGRLRLRWAAFEGSPCVAEAKEQLHGVERLLQQLEVVAAAAGVAEEVEGAGLAGEEKDAAVAVDAADVDGEVDAAEIGHHDVGEQDVGGLIEGADKGAVGAVEGLGVEAVAVEDGGEGFGDDPLVVDDVDALGGALGGDGLRHEATPEQIVKY